ncbi:MAG: thioredoxin domain-containing protein [Candidatus Paceibacterota bacterium]
MNTKRIIFWLCFVVLLGLIVWGLIAANNKPALGLKLGEPAPISATDHVRGPADAKVTLIEYADFQCPACAAYNSLVERLYLEASTTLRLVYRHFPLPQHQNARITAQATEAAAVQGKFWEMASVVYANQSDWAELSDADARKMLAGYAADLGLDAQKFATDIDADAGKERISDQLAEGQSLGVNGTPTFFVNGKAIQNPQGYDQFKAIIDTAAN